MSQFPRGPPPGFNKLTLFFPPLSRDKKQTMTQNYRRLGLVSRLRAPTGGVEPDDRKKSPAGAAAVPAPKPTRTTKPTDPFAIAPATNSVVSEARVERDATGRIVRILDGSSSSTRSRLNPLNDPLNALESDSEEEDNNDDDGDGEEWGGIDAPTTKTEVVRQLEAEAGRPVEKRPRTQSRREREWLASLVDKHGPHDLRAMARDRALNPMQQTEADIARRLRKWRAEGGDGDDGE